jgi:predicted nucleic acid-binding protein
LNEYFFFDSSSYVKLFVAEAGSQDMIDVFTQSEDQRLFVSALAAIEVRSAVRRRQFAGDIDERDASIILDTVVKETDRIAEQPVTSKVVAEAIGIVDRHSLRALDSLQLASAMIVRGTISGGASLIFTASDDRLLRAAEAEGLEIWNPLRGPLMRRQP